MRDKNSTMVETIALSALLYAARPSDYRTPAGPVKAAKILVGSEAERTAAAAEARAAANRLLELAAYLDELSGYPHE